MICSRCKVDKDYVQDFIHGKTKCRECYKKCCEYYKLHRKQAIARATKSQNRDRVETNRKKRDRYKRKPVAVIYWSIKNRAKTKGIPFNLKQEDIVIPEFCPILGLRLQRNEGKPGSNSPSLDRINPVYGYVKGNVQVISHRANMIKSSATIDELKKLLHYMEQHEQPDLIEQKYF